VKNSLTVEVSILPSVSSAIDSYHWVCLSTVCPSPSHYGIISAINKPNMGLPLDSSKEAKFICQRWTGIPSVWRSSDAKWAWISKIYLHRNVDTQCHNSPLDFWLHAQWQRIQTWNRPFSRQMLHNSRWNSHLVWVPGHHGIPGSKTAENLHSKHQHNLT